MKTSRLFLIVSFFFLASLLSACGGSAGVANSWPGLTVEENTAYLAYNQHVYAINLANGAETWRFPVEADNKVSFYAPPAVEDGKLFAGGYNNTLYSLNPANGALNWTFTGAKNRYVASPLVNQDHIFAPSADGKLYTLDSSGKLVWPFETQHALWGTPATDGKLIYLPAMDHHVYALDAENGDVVWKTDDLGGAVVGNPTLGPDGPLYVGTFARQMLALDPQNGQIKNSYSTSGWVWSGPTLDDGRLFFGDLDGFLYALNAADLSEIWKIQPDTLPQQAISDKPLLIEDTLYVTSESGNVYAVDAANGSVRWTKTIGGKLYAAPVAAGDSILVTPLGIDSILIALGSDGNQKWAFTPQK